ncbi:GNAT family N-acetyltransferase [Alkalihalobacterium chitinilyticum]|uniref:Acetyltransferase n=1 Tax=Alkalihalobacterium chitinilyticum TaxID=2980103 RepID=A0ABT5VDB8_9BACI|nr:GNAT family N-acetyltransferase [Alkalihalobacterium chitinilyticum]MDE5413440.1 acetyltransferase [Alkalihalobacterium chitinilyticum]
MLAAKGRLSIRKLMDCESDYKLLFKWLNDEVVQEFYEGKSVKHTLEQIHDEYRSRAIGENYVQSCIIVYGEIAIGYLQYYHLQPEEIKVYGAARNEQVYGIDLFIGEPTYWNKGIGTDVIKLTVDFLFSKKGVHEIFIDPQTWNERAIACYEKCGFQKVKVLPKREIHDGEYKDNQIMRITHEEFKDN